jgi:hypothetical protein
MATKTKTIASKAEGELGRDRDDVLPQIRLFEHDNYEGDVLEIFGHGGTASLRAIDEDWNDEVSSVIVIAGTWELFFHDNFDGRKLTLRPGTYPSIEQAGNGIPPGATPEPAGQGWNDQLSSLRTR